MANRTLPYPVLKWAGGKARMLGRIVSRLPNQINTYYEPFIGGGAVFFELARENRFKHAIISDLNEDLINCYRTIQSDVDSLIDELKSSKYQYDKSVYLSIRALKSTELNSIERSARFIYLNKTCFNGLYRVNSSGHFNVPFGSYKAPVILDEPALRAASEAFKNATILVSDFNDPRLDDATKGDAVYLDPPYIPISETSSFTGYNQGGFSLDDHRRLAEMFQKLNNASVSVILSNSSAPLAKELYSEFEIVELIGSRSVGGPAEYRKSVTEIIVFGNQ